VACGPNSPWVRLACGSLSTSRILFPFLGEGARQVVAGRGLTHPALLVQEHDGDGGHQRPTSRGRIGRVSDRAGRTTPRPVHFSEKGRSLLKLSATGRIGERLFHFPGKASARRRARCQPARAASRGSFRGGHPTLTDSRSIWPMHCTSRGRTTAPHRKRVSTSHPSHRPSSASARSQRSRVHSDFSRFKSGKGSPRYPERAATSRTACTRRASSDSSRPCRIPGSRSTRR